MQLGQQKNCSINLIPAARGGKLGTERPAIAVESAYVMAPQPLIPSAHQQGSSRYQQGSHRELEDPGRGSITMAATVPGHLQVTPLQP